MSQKYRPYFTLPELEEINRALQQSITPARQGIVRYLSRYILEIREGLREPNHTLKPTIEDRLGMGPVESPLYDGAKCYEMWQNNIPLSPAQLSAMMEYRYQNDLMSPQEEAEFETRMLQKAKGN